jgi:uncharacterized membrane protein YozB (DUF420 family)
MLLTGYLLASTAYVETTLILFLHVLGAMATMGGVLGVLVLYLRARGAHRAIGSLDGEGGLAAARAHLGSAGVAVPVWLMLILTMAIVYFMMFQPLVRS